MTSFPRPTTLLLLGEDATNADFLRAVEEALREIYQGFDVEVVSALSDLRSDRMDPLYLAARGAAEFAKRVQEASFSCPEPESCAHDRRPLHAQKGDQVVLAGDL